MLRMFMKRIMMGDRRKIYVIVIPEIKLSRVIPITVNNMLDAREVIVKRKSFLFLVVYLTKKGISINSIANRENIVNFSTLVQLFQRFKNIPILHSFNFI
jgi:hypothetical protein